MPDTGPDIPVLTYPDTPESVSFSRRANPGSLRRLRSLENHAIGVVNNELHQVFVCGLVQMAQIFPADALPLNLAFETRVQFPLERIVVNRQYDLRALEDRIVGERIAQVYRNDGREPTVAMHDIRAPAELLDRFEHAPGKEDRPLVVNPQKTLRLRPGSWPCGENSPRCR